MSASGMPTLRSWVGVGYSAPSGFCGPAAAFFGDGVAAVGGVVGVVVGAARRFKWIQADNDPIGFVFTDGTLSRTAAAAFTRPYP